MGMSMLSYDIEDQTGFPFDHLYGQRVKDAVGIDVVLPVTLESNVIKLHEFLYPEDSYTPSEEVKAYSQRIVDKSGLEKSQDWIIRKMAPLQLIVRVIRSKKKDGK